MGDVAAATATEAYFAERVVCGLKLKDALDPLLSGGDGCHEASSTPTDDQQIPETLRIRRQV